MDEAVTLIFRVIEPMMFRGSGEFDPWVRGTYSRASTLAMPSPSTIAGALASYCISELGLPPPDGDDWIDNYLKVLGDEVVIKGPLIKLNDKLMVEDKLLGGFLNMEEMSQKCEKEWNRLIRDPSSLTQLEDYLKEEYEKRFKPSVKLSKETRVGVMLETRTRNFSKHVAEGYLFTAEYLNYAGIRKERNEETQTEIVAEVRGKLSEVLTSVLTRPIKLGGESRIALLSFYKGGKIYEMIKTKIWNNKEKHEGILALYVATPSLFKGGTSVKEYVKKWAESANYKLIGLCGESEALGAGFMLVNGRRKPIYTSLKQGSIVFLEGSFDLSQIYLDGNFGEATALGYGTLIPVPLSGRG